MVKKRNKSKGQGLVEFALILPILAILLMGIFEMGRVVWAYITVQTAAREAARYAITGKPYVHQNNLEEKSSLPDGLCTLPEGEENVIGSNGRKADTPWLCSPEARAEAIKNVARERGATLVGGIADYNRLPECPYPLEYGSFVYNWSCEERDAGGAKVGYPEPNIFGVQIIGQTIDPKQHSTGSATEPIPLADYAGDEGLNVAIYTFYNVKMMTPIFDTIMGGLPLTVRGEAQMQNEGVNPALGSSAPPPIPANPPLPPGVPPCPSGVCGGDGEEILALNGYTHSLGGNLQVQLRNHDQVAGPYEVYLHTIVPPGSGLPVMRYRICGGVSTNNQGTAIESNCDMSLIPAGEYCLYSIFGTDSPDNISCDLNAIARAAEYVVISDEGSSPYINLSDKLGLSTSWATCSDVQVGLFAHEPDTYRVILTVDGKNQGGPLDPTLVVPDSGQAVFNWTIPYEGIGETPPCLTGSGNFCQIESVVGSTTVASTTFQISKPSINIVNAKESYLQGDVLRVNLTGHTPNRSYDLMVMRRISGTLELIHQQVIQVNSSGSSRGIIPVEIVSGPNGWPDGDYEVATYPVGTTEFELESSCTFGTAAEFKVESSTDPYITIKSGIYEWPIGSYINIELFNHEPGSYYLYFDSVERGNDPYRIPNDNTPNDYVIKIDVNSDGRATIGYEIPFDAATGKDKVPYQIYSVPVGSSGLSGTPGNRDADSFYADLVETLYVLPQPIIYVFEGDRACLAESDPDFDRYRVDDPTPPAKRSVLPDGIITICVKQHTPQYDYNLYYNNRDMLRGTSERTLQTISDGSGRRVYDLADFPIDATFDLTNPATWGQSYPLYSVDPSSGQAVASTTLKIQAVDLVSFRVDKSKCKTVQDPSTNQYAINQPCNIDFYIANNSVIDLPSSYVFDIDMYHYYDNELPSKKLTPAYRGANSFNFPGDYKQWSSLKTELQDGFQADEEVKFTRTFTPTTYGQHDFYVYVDTTNFVNEDTEYNNVYSATLELTCKAQPIGKTVSTFPYQAGDSQSITPPFTNDAEAAQWDGVNHGRISDDQTAKFDISGGVLFASHGGGQRISSGQDVKSAYYYDELLPSITLAKVTIDPTLSFPVPYGNQGIAGIELRESKNSGSKLVQFGVMRNNPSQNDDYRPIVSWRDGDFSALNYARLEGAEGRISPDKFPITLEIRRNLSTNNITFFYQTSGGTRQQMYVNGSVDSSVPAHLKSTVASNGQALVYVSESELTLNDQLYVGLFASTDRDSPSVPASIFDGGSTDFSKLQIDYELPPNAPADWTVNAYGNMGNDENQYDVKYNTNDRLELRNTGSNYQAYSDIGANGYVFAQYNKTQASTENGFELSTTFGNVSRAFDLTNSTNAAAGLEVRNSAASDSSAKLQFMLVALPDSFGGGYVPEAYYRSSSGATKIWEIDENFTPISSPDGVSLKITREPERGRFRFYVNGNEIFSNDVAQNTEAGDIEGAVDVGVFNYSGSVDGFQTAEFRSFAVKFQDCEAGIGNAGKGNQVGEIGTPPHDPPFGLQLCTPGVNDSGFEQNLEFRQWKPGNSSGAFYQPGSYDGSRYMMVGKTDESSLNPFFYQRFNLDDWVLETTELQLSFQFNVDEGSSPEEADKFKAVVVKKEPNVSAPIMDADTIAALDPFSEIVEIVNGSEGIGTLSGQPTDTSFQARNISLPLEAGEDLDYDGDLYLLVFNSSSGLSCEREGTCHNTVFYFENMQLNTCTTNPKPTEIDINAMPNPTHVSGQATLYYSLGDGGTTKESIKGVRVWAYAENGELYETTTIQNGEFNFYNLPAKPASEGGTTYTLYAEKVVRKEDGTLVEFGENVNIILTSDSPGNRVLGVPLNLFDVEFE